ncbi:hypothetical protein niasHT_031897 [Heterodera trifolii]|uniref:Uncharacterized protein n=1 Tax=Heterodera trifolii TaxID=157864 RepID=A0ABD2HY98_9BILA
MKPTSDECSVKCAVCSRPSKYFFYGVKCCESCKHFFRRSISLKKEYKCKNGRQCELEKDSASCKRCRLNKCLSVGMNSLRVSIKSKRVSGQAAPTNSSNLEEVGTDLSAITTFNNAPPKWAVPNSPLVQQNFAGFILMKYLLEVERKVRRIRDSQTHVPSFFFDQCDSFEAIFRRKPNLIERANEFSPKLPNPLDPAKFAEIVRQKGAFFVLPGHLALDLLFVFEIARTFTFFERLDISDKIALCSDIASPLLMLSNGFYSAQQNSDIFSVPNGWAPITLFKNAYYKDDPIVAKMSDKVLCKASVPFIRLKLNTEEFVLLRAIIFAHMVSPGLSDQAQKLLLSEAEKYSSLLMSILQINYGAAAGALRYVELMGLINFAFISGTKHRHFLTYISNVLDPNFDRVMPPVLAKICTKGPVELHQLLPY